MYVFPRHLLFVCLKEGKLPKGPILHQQHTSVNGADFNMGENWNVLNSMELLMDTGITMCFGRAGNTESCKKTDLYIYLEHLYVALYL